MRSANERFGASARALVAATGLVLGGGAAACSVDNSSDSSRPATSSGPVPGVTEDAITIGLGYVPDGRRLAGQSGAEGVTLADGRATAEAVVSYINGEGGVAGRQVELVFHEYTGAQAEDSNATRYQTACDNYTIDHEVYAVFQQSVHETLLACLAERDTLLIGGGVLPGDETVFEQYRGVLFAPQSMTLDDMVEALLVGLDETGFWQGPDPTVGLLRLDRPDINRVTDRVLRPALEADGHPVDEEIVVQSPERLSEIAVLSQAVQSSVLRMKTAGVTHLIFLDERGGLPVYFMHTAETQGFTARYAFTSSSNFSYVKNNVPAAQLANVFGLGWTPLADVGRTAAVGATTETRALCEEIFRGAGIEFDSDTAEAVATSDCGDLLWFKQVGDTAEGLDHGAFTDAVESLGDGWAPASTFASNFSAGRHAGAAEARTLDFDAACECFTYGSVVPVG